MRKIKLNRLSKREMSNSQQSKVLGGVRSCTCSCYYRNEPGGSSIRANGAANIDLGPEGGHSVKGDNKYHGVGSDDKYHDNSYWIEK